MTSRVPTLPAVLTDRQAQMLPLIAEGLEDREIADRLYLARSTVKRHVSGLLVRLGARNRTHLVAVAYQRGFLSIGDRETP